jgi:uncharacterized membrane protein
MAKNQIENEKACAVLSYILIGLIWYLADDKMKKSNFAKYHVKQGLVLLIASIVYSILLGIIFSIILFPIIMTGAGVGLVAIFSLLYYVPLIWTIIGIINAVNDKEKELPIIGKYAEKFSF